MSRHLSKLAVLVGAVVALYGPMLGVGPNQVATAAAEPTAMSADALILSADDVRRVAAFDDMNPIPVSDVRAPAVGQGPGFGVPGQCRVASDQNLTFAPGWTQFRSVTYRGAGDRAVIQSVAVYPDEGAAVQALSQLADQLSACSDAHTAAFPFQVHRQDAATVSWCFGDGCPVQYHVKSSALIEVRVVGFPPTAGRTASQLMQTISDRINA